MSGLNAGLCLYDVSEAETEEEFYNSIEGFGWNLLGIGTGAATTQIGIHVSGKVRQGVDIVVNIYNFWSEFGDEIKKKIGL